MSIFHDLPGRDLNNGDNNHVELSRDCSFELFFFISEHSFFKLKSLITTVTAKHYNNACKIANIKHTS